MNDEMEFQGLGFPRDATRGVALDKSWLTTATDERVLAFVIVDPASQPNASK